MASRGGAARSLGCSPPPQLPFHRALPVFLLQEAVSIPAGNPSIKQVKHLSRIRIGSQALQ